MLFGHQMLAYRCPKLPEIDEAFPLHGSAAVIGYRDYSPFAVQRLLPAMARGTFMRLTRLKLSPRRPQLLPVTESVVLPHDPGATPWLFHRAIRY